MRSPLLVTLLTLLANAACGSSYYCQSGPKYGTQCYSDPTTLASGEPPAEQEEEDPDKR